MNLPFSDKENEFAMENTIFQLKIFFDNLYNAHMHASRVYLYLATCTGDRIGGYQHSRRKAGVD